jgi:murein DD-endopeptidase MepM/ murein hydrolase activator NlpD
MRPIVLMLLLLPLPAAALELRVHPGEVVYTYEVEPQRGLSNVFLHNIAVVQPEGGAVTIESLEIQVLRDGQAVQTLLVPAADLDKSVQRIAAIEAQGLLKLYDFHFQTSRYLKGIRIASSRTLEPGTALIVTGKPLLLSGKTDSIAIHAHGRDAAGKPVEARAALKVESHRSPNEYVFPVPGVSYIAVGADLQGPHRWVVNEEFAFDIAALGGDGRTHKGTGGRLEDYFGYGRDVVAVADGEVLEVVSDAAEANDRLRQPGESVADYEKRTVMAQNELLMKSPKAPLGNWVVIRHGGGEFSHYAHLKQGSVRVKAGDKVKAGQVIAQLGHTGNTTEPHLHFQLTDGADPLYSRGLPVVFKNNVVDSFGYEGRPLQTGWVVITK